ncbi:MAG: FtsQ-type POTRA domain-containing protein [Deltaproteobacteria bacterium]|jgi:cell division protein FtsQ|nr:FtsQ-type POTRA domain-containing protein [Deltaproteobacteria bacterium]
MSQKIIKVIIMILLPIIIFVPLWKLNEQGYFELKEIKFENAYWDRQDFYLDSLKQHLNAQLENFKGKSLFQIDLSEVVKIISNEKWIRNFEVQREWPNSLKVKINKFDIVMLYWDENNDVFPIFENNEMLDKINKNQIPDRVHLYDRKVALQKDLRKKTIDLIQRLPEKGPLNQNEIAEVGYNKKTGFWLQLIKNDLLIQMGEDKIEIKSERVSNVMEYLESKRIDARVIDANLSQKVLVRLRKGP